MLPDGADTSIYKSLAACRAQLRFARLVTRHFGRNCTWLCWWRCISGAVELGSTGDDAFRARLRLALLVMMHYLTRGRQPPYKYDAVRSLQVPWALQYSYFYSGGTCRDVLSNFRHGRRICEFRAHGSCLSWFPEWIDPSLGFQGRASWFRYSLDILSEA